MTPAERDSAERAMRANPDGGWRKVVRDMAIWDESHTAPAVEIMADQRISAPKAIKQLEEDYASERMRRMWREQVADQLAEYGLGTNAQLDEAYAVYVEALLEASRKRVMRGLGVVNPADDSPDEDERAQAADLYERFHRYPPTKLGEFERGFMIPARMLRVGPALWTTYRSAKVDPATLKKPKRPVDYIHEHDAGVDVYVTIEDGAENGWTGTDSAYDDVVEVVEVPSEFQRAKALVKLGENLGYKFRLGDEEIEAEGDEPLPELYATPDGKCLLVIQDKRDVVAMIWGGALGVFPRGIDG